MGKLSEISRSWVSKKSLGQLCSLHQHQPYPKPPLKVNQNLREQHFGVAEGQPWVRDAPEDIHIPIETCFQQRISRGRHEKFPEGESEDDLARRAEVAIRECVLPHLPYAPVPQDQYSGVHVAIASHGQAIGQMVLALIMLDPEETKKKIIMA